MYEDEADVSKNQMQEWVHRAIGSTESTSTLIDQVSLEAILQDPNATPKDFDRAQARAMNRLSFEERERTYEEIHGVAPIQEETPAFLQLKLQELQSAIADIPKEQQCMYQEAILDPVGRIYVTSARFQLQFLRAERFDATKAATRMLLCCEKKVHFFGRPTLTRALRLTDLSEKELAALKAGAFQVLQRRDRSGRLVVVDTSLCGPKLYTDLFSYYKCFWYMIMSAIEDDEETQKRGIVAIVWWMHHKLNLDPDFDSELRQETIASLKWLPMRPYSSTHLCIDDNHSTMKLFLGRFMMAMSPKDMRYGIQLHRGSNTEVSYKLMTYGIPVDAIPVSSSGVVKTKDFGRWIQKRRYKDEYLARVQSNTQDTLKGDESSGNNDQLEEGHVSSFLFLKDKIDLPTNQDVLLGTGKILMKHPGNQAFRAAVEAMAEAYAKATSPGQKAEITMGVVRFLQNEQGGRFLKRDASMADSSNNNNHNNNKKNSNNDQAAAAAAAGFWWVVASDQEARIKTGKAFISQRSARRASTAFSTTSTTSSSLVGAKNNSSGIRSSPSTSDIPGTSSSSSNAPIPDPQETLDDSRVVVGTRSIIGEIVDQQAVGDRTKKRFKVGHQKEDIDDSSSCTPTCFGMLFGSPTSTTSRSLNGPGASFNTQGLVWGQNQLELPLPTPIDERAYTRRNDHGGAATEGQRE